MKTLILLNFFLTYLFSDTSTYQDRTCNEIMKEIKILKGERLDEPATQVAKISTFLLTGHYIAGGTDKDAEMKIRVLKLELKNCRQEYK